MKTVSQTEVLKLAFKIDGFLRRVSSKTPPEYLPRVLLLETIAALSASAGALYLYEKDLLETFAISHKAPLKKRMLSLLERSVSPNRQLFLDIDNSQKIAAPLWYSRQIVGILYVEYRQFDYGIDSFTEDDKALLIALADTASLTLEKAAIEEENRHLKSTALHYKFIIGNSPPVRQLLSRVETIIKQDINVSILIEGETGTGKNLLAKAIHQQGFRKDKPFIHVICPNIESQLAESQLFGHKKGAFTSAIADHDGFIAQANGGILFFDEITEFDLNLQAKLLGVLQEHIYQKLGDTHTYHSDFQLICATNKNLEEEVHAGRFREDLYYRLKTFKLTVPPLRERAEDIPLLANHFIERLNQESKSKKVHSVSPRALQALRKHHWPGNIRELEQVITSAFISCEKGIIEVELLDPAVAKTQNHDRLIFDKVLPLEEAISHYVQFAYQKSGCHKIKTMETLEIAFRRLQRYLSRNKNQLDNN